MPERTTADLINELYRRGQRARRKTVAKVEVKEFTKMLPAAPGHCQVCAVKHGPGEFHDCRSLYYQVQFHGKFGRWPTWADASAHCTEQVRAALRQVLAANGIEWTEPPSGAEVIDQPYRET